MFRKAIALTLVILFVAAGLAGCGEPVGTKDFVLRVNIGPQPDSIDPAYNEAVDGGTMINHFFEGLMIVDKNSVPQPGMAKSYTVSDDELTYTFTLRDDAKWSDGQALTTADFIYAWERCIDPKNATAYGYMFDVIKGADVYYTDIEATPDYTLDIFHENVVAVDEKTLKVTLNAPCPYFLELCAFPCYAPIRKDMVETGEDWATKPETYIGNGPYKMTEWAMDSQIVAVKNENYYNYEKLGPKEIDFVLMDDDNAILAAYQTGDIMLADTMPNDEIDAWRDKPDFHLQGQIGTYYVAFNTTRAPFDNAKVREALSLVIDRNYVVENIGKAGQLPAGAFVSYGLSDSDTKKEFREVGGDYYSVKKEDQAANVEKAKQLLTDAGYPNGEGFPTFEYMYNTGSGHKLIGEYLQQQWKETLGINCTLAEQEWGVFLTTRQNAEYDVARNGWLGDYNDPISFLDMFVSANGNNDSKYNNPNYDTLINEIKTSHDRKTRYSKMHQAEDMMMKDHPVAPIYYYVDIFLKSEKLGGFYASPLGFKYFMYTTLL